MFVYRLLCDDLSHSPPALFLERVIDQHVNRIIPAPPAHHGSYLGCASSAVTSPASNRSTGAASLHAFRCMRVFDLTACAASYGSFPDWRRTLSRSVSLYVVVTVYSSNKARSAQWVWLCQGLPAIWITSQSKVSHIIQYIYPSPRSTSFIPKRWCDVMSSFSFSFFAGNQIRMK